jgi:hypothetical protein
VSVISEVFAELFSMFAGDARLSLGTLGVVVLAAAAAAWFATPVVAGAVLLVGSLGVLVVSVLLAARRKP